MSIKEKDKSKSLFPIVSASLTEVVRGHFLPIHKVNIGDWRLRSLGKISFRSLSELSIL